MSQLIFTPAVDVEPLKAGTGPYEVTVIVNPGEVEAMVAMGWPRERVRTWPVWRPDYRQPVPRADGLRAWLDWNDQRGGMA